MTEQQPVEGTPATPEATPAEGSQATPPTERTAAEVEAEYKARLSGKDKAHAGEVEELRRQLEAAQTTGQTAATEAQQGEQTVEQLKAQLAQEQKARESDKRTYATDLRSTKYPYAAEALDPNALAAMDEAKLAGLNARLTPNPHGGVDPSTPPKGAEAPRPTNEKTTAELKQDLARMGPQFAEELRSR